MELDIQSRYDAMLDVAKARNPAREPKPGSRRRVRQSPAHNLVKRLSENRDAVLRFLTDLRVPFDNNQAERDVRMPKLKQKVSGCFRSDQGIVRIPTKVATHSEGKRPPVPIDSGQSVRRKMAGDSDESGHPLFENATREWQSYASAGSRVKSAPFFRNDSPRNASL